MLIGRLDILLKARAERVKAEKNKIKKQYTFKEKEIESLEAPIDKEGSPLLGLTIVGLPLLSFAFWLTGLENFFVNIVGIVLFILFVFLLVLITFLKDFSKKNLKRQILRSNLF